jgi:hypothetical protein
MIPLMILLKDPKKNRGPKAVPVQHEGAEKAPEETPTELVHM